MKEYPLLEIQRETRLTKRKKTEKIKQKMVLKMDKTSAAAGLRRD
jgi:hypothetical protein